MIELKKCCKVPFPENLFEKYEAQENAIYANVNASKIIDIMKRFVEMHNEPMFFILEIPCKEYDGITDSKTLISANNDYDVYFIDGLDKELVNQCLDALGDFLTKDGMNTFGVGGHESHEEILFGKYNVMTIYTKSADEYRELMSSFGIKITESLVTAWDTFDASHPGECSLYVSEKTGKTIYDIPDAYKELGMYLYEERKEYDGAIEKEITLDELVGKLLLVGITYYTDSDELIEQKQFFGTVTEANESFILIKQPDGTVFSLPSDLSSTKRARPGEYKLRSTGEIVTNPDFFATWNLIKGE